MSIIKAIDADMKKTRQCQWQSTRWHDEIHSNILAKFVISNSVSSSDFLLLYVYIYVLLYMFIE